MVYHAAIETNNGIEAQNKALKYKFLPRTSISSSNVVTIIIEQFLPEQNRNYLFLNFQMDPTYRGYSSEVPTYLHGRPKNIIVHCLAREEKARKTFSEDDICESDEDKGIFIVKGKSGVVHTINFGKESGKPSCTCQDWTRHNVPCKHFFLIFITKIQWGWTSLPQSYLQGPYLSCDNNALESIQRPLDSSSSFTDNANAENHPENIMDQLPYKVT